MATPITATEAAKELGVSVRRVQAMIQAGQLPAKKIGIQYLINRSDLAKVKGRKPGRPRKAAE